MLLQLLELCWSLISHVGSSRNTRMPIDEILRRVQKYTFWISIFIFLPGELVALLAGICETPHTVFWPKRTFLSVKVSFNNAPPEYYQQWQQGIKWRYYFGRSFVWPCH